MPNILKYLSLGALFLLLSRSYAQELINSSLDLNPGGVIHDVAYDEHNDVYIFVGDFTSLNGVSCPNIAFVNAVDFTVNTEENFNIISTINGPIYSIEFINHLYVDFGVLHRYTIYLGGDFSIVNGLSRNGGAKLLYVGTGSYEPIDHAYSLNGWNPSIQALFEVNPVIHAIESFGDTVVFGGDFEHITTGLPALISYDVFSNDQIEDYPSTADFSSFGGGWPRISHLEYFQNALYISKMYTAVGPPQVERLLNDGELAVDFNLDLPSSQGYFQIRGFDDSLLVLLYSYPGDGGIEDIGEYTAVVDAESAERFIEHSFDQPSAPDPGANYSQLELYKDFIFTARNIGDPHKSIFSIRQAEFGTEITDINWSANTNDHLNLTDKNHLFILNNILFISTDELTEAEGFSRIGLAAYCLEPMDLEEFIEFDTLICQSDTATYSVAQVDFVDGYIWTYTGTGVDIGNTGAAEKLADTVYNLYEDAWIRDIRFTEEFSVGELIVTPFSICGAGGVSEENMLKGDSISITINTNPLPNAYAGEDFSLTCDILETPLHGHSDTADVMYEWVVLGGDDLDIYPHQDTTVNSNDTFRLKVINNIGCFNLDTVVIFLDTIRPNFDPILGPFDLTCSDSVRTYLGFCNNLTDTTSFWVELASHDTVSNPIDVNLPGQYNFYTINNENGCIDSLPAPIVVYLNQPSPNIELVGYIDPPLDEPLDTIDCYEPTITIECYSDTASTLLNWVNADSTDPIGEIITISETGNYFILAQNTENGCYNFKGINIAADFSKPNVILPVISNINCSNDSLVLNGGTIFTDTILEWTGDAIIPSDNPVTIFDAGWYYLTITKNDNGCSEIDSIEVIADNSIDVIIGNDTIVCDESLLYLTVDYIGDIGGISYLWNNGETDDGTFFTGGIDDYASVEVFGDDDCYGLDTIRIEIPPVPVIEFQAFQPCGEGATGSIIATAISGFGPFEYSIDDGETFQDSPALTGLDFGTYTIWVRDTLDCLYSFEATIDQSSALPEPTFIFSTYNFQMDTVIVIDVSNPPTDSVQWEFSEEINYVGELDGSPLISLPETGSFFITMNAFYGDCMISSTKEVFVTEFDSTFANFSNQNGIKSIELYPNPTTGIFNVEVEYYKKQRASLTVQDMMGYVYSDINYEEVDVISEVIELDYSAIDGTYVLRIISEFDSAYITFVLSR